ncbi:LOW QUALITY PROTEIN: protein sel-1 homolog 1 [Battus philenor]|uniref:LOW QUALITY PROTEIN: protein sel-1 homolog 1 n=1 Tax=Battus philenor TaxID=42288 RepID=UPI0035CE962F
MSRMYWLAICLCFGFSFCELLGPNSQKDGIKSDDETDNSKKNDKKDKETAEYLMKLREELITMQIIPESMKDNLNMIEEFSETLNELLRDPDELSDNHLDQMKFTLAMLKKYPLLKHSLPLTDLEKAKHNADAKKEKGETKDVFGNILDVPEEEELVTTAEMKEAKAIYDKAMSELLRRPAETRAPMLQVKFAAERGYRPAQAELAWYLVFGDGVERDLDLARSMFEELAADGYAEGHAGLGFLYATGLGVGVSQARALLYYTLGAAGGSDYAQMALAYRHWAEVTVPVSCPKALQLYTRVAAKVASKVSLSGGPGVQRVRLLDEAEGGAGALDSDLIEYYQLLADKGDVQAQVGLGQLHFQGGHGVPLDISKALHYFQQAAKTGNAVANAFLGKIYLEGGEGVRPNNETALHYFQKAAELNNPVGQSGLGIMYLQGRGVFKDTTVALKYFTMSANQGWVEGQLYLGFMYFGGIGVRRDFKQANKYFSLASQSGHVLALYHLAQMHAQGLGVPRSCTTAVELLKNVCERGAWSARLMAAHAAWRARSADAALAQYLALAERGLEVAQSNAAFLLDSGESRLFPGEQRYRRALQLWGRAAAQGCAGARVKLGDYHYYGLGTAPDLEAAAFHYRIASEQLHNAQATFNLGYMHERGLGLARDLHLAKRCYDLAADTAPEARLPAALALARLHAAAAVHRLADSLVDSPLAALLLSGEGSLLHNWDAYLIGALTTALGVVVLLRRPQRQTDRPARPPASDNCSSGSTARRLPLPSPQGPTNARTGNTCCDVKVPQRRTPANPFLSQPSNSLKARPPASHRALLCAVISTFGRAGGLRLGATLAMY